jgi:hypothetical protein
MAPVRMSDVATRAGVSTATVSMVLSGRDTARVSPQTRWRVLEAADAVGYELNSVARSLRTHRRPGWWARSGGTTQTIVTLIGPSDRHAGHRGHVRPLVGAREGDELLGQREPVPHHWGANPGDTRGAYDQRNESVAANVEDRPRKRECAAAAMLCKRNIVPNRSGASGSRSPAFRVGCRVGRGTWTCGARRSMARTPARGLRSVDWTDVLCAFSGFRLVVRRPRRSGCGRCRRL